MLDVAVALGSLAVGFVVGMTGMGGGALMTPLLVLGFGIEPLAAVSSDLVAAAAMKPLGGAVHSRRGTVRWPLVKHLVLGSVPAAFAGVWLLRELGPERALDGIVKASLGVALLLVSLTLSLRPYFTRLPSAEEASAAPLAVRPAATVVLGAIGGLVVGLTSVGSGSLMILGLLLLYPRLRLRDLVGTDLVQAVPLVASAALAHVIFGEFRLGLTTSLLVGGIPGVFVGARLSSRFPDHYIRPALVAVLAASGMKLLGAPTVTVGWVVFGVLSAFALEALSRRRRCAATG
jgi:uncharacterized membrane protein YfcA